MVTYVFISFFKNKSGKVTKNVRQLLFLRHHLKLKIISSVNKPKHFPEVVICSVKEPFFRSRNVSFALHTVFIPSYSEILVYRLITAIEETGR